MLTNWRLANRSSVKRQALLWAQPRLVVAYPFCACFCFVSGVSSAPPCLLATDPLPVMSYGYCFVIGSVPRSGLATADPPQSFEDPPSFLTPHVCTTSLSHRCPCVPTAGVATSTKRTYVLLNTHRDGSRSMRVGTKQQGTTKAMEALFPVRALRAYNCQSSRL